MMSNGVDKKPSKGEYLEVLLRSPKTVFSTKDVALLWGEKGNIYNIDTMCIMYTYRQNGYNMYTK